jgi:hypothetical protein
MGASAPPTQNGCDEKDQKCEDYEQRGAAEAHIEREPSETKDGQEFSLA